MKEVMPQGNKCQYKTANEREIGNAREVGNEKAIKLKVMRGVWVNGWRQMESMHSNHMPGTQKLRG